MIHQSENIIKSSNINNISIIQKINTIINNVVVEQIFSINNLHYFINFENDKYTFLRNNIFSDKLYLIFMLLIIWYFYFNIF